MYEVGKDESGMSGTNVTILRTGSSSKVRTEVVNESNTGIPLVN